MELNISFAKISTKVDQVVDVFYVTDLEGQKIRGLEETGFFALTEIKILSQIFFALEE